MKNYRKEGDLKMKGNTSKPVAFILILLILIYNLAVFLPHTHDCFDSECTACSVIALSRDTFGTVILRAALICSLWLLLIIEESGQKIVSVREGTLVGLKVKLSD